ncbi:unnamed protein product [Phaedon cochleariae]|uniref:SH2 domain-containing protein n=1 Tax=Phaedon cochleariae TaxID=80249 RepID=A0A9N9X4F6_PHACE|nr:unnamed protein product [Phaedon cochleariae]
MDLEAIKILDKEQLIRIISQSGYVDIAEILGKLDLNGNELLDATDFQAIKWKITLLQRKQLLFFIKQLKSNPFILNKIAPSVAPKPKSQLTLPLKKTFQPPPPQFSSDQKETNKSRFPDIKTSVGRNKGFANELEKVLGGTNKTVNKLPPSICPLLGQGNVTVKREKLPLPLRDENHSISQQEQDEFYINLPAQPKHANHGFPNEIVEDIIEDTYYNVKNTFENGSKSSSGRNIAQHQNSSQPGGDPDIYELPQPPPPPQSRIVLSKQINKSTFPKQCKIVEEKFNQPPALEPEDLYEPPPRVNLPKNPVSSVIRSLSTSSKKKWESPQVLPAVQSPEETDEEDNYEVPNEHNVPRKIFDPPVAPTKRSNLRSKSPMQNEEEDDYEPAPTCLVPGLSRSSVSPVANRKPIPTPTRNYDNPPLRIELNKQKGTNNLSLLPPQKDRPSNTIDFPSSSDQMRANNIPTALDNPVGKNRLEMNYENHAMKSEKSSFRKFKPNSLVNRPLPEIPKISEPKASPIKVPMDYRWQTSSSSTNSNHSIFEKPATYVELTKNHNVNYESKSYVIDDDDNQIYENNQPNALNEPDEEPTEYENLSPLNSPQHQKVEGHNQQKRNELPKTSIQDSLVLQLTSELSALKKIQNRPIIDLENNQPEYRNTSVPPKRITNPRNNTMRGEVKTPPTSTSRKNHFLDVPVRSPIPCLPKPPVHFNPASYITEPTDDEDFEESDDEGAGNIFNINNEPYFRNTDRKGAKSLLRTLEDGAFLFRPSRHYFLVLTIKTNNKFYNLGIERTKNDKIKLNSDTGSVPPEFSNLRDFVDHFTNEAVTFQVGNELLETYLKPVLPPDLF